MKNRNVMLIDDNKIDLFVNQRIIEKFDPSLKTRLFNNAISAITYFKLLENNTRIKSLELPDVVLLDINMPEMNGFNFFEEFKELNFSNKSKIQVYLLSSSMCPNDIIRAQEETHCAGYVTKPLTISKLETLLHQPAPIEFQEHFKKII